MPELSERIASLEANFAAIDRRAMEHERSDAARFDQNFAYTKAMKAEIMGGINDLKDRFIEMETKVQTLWDDMNKREGAFGFGKFIAAAVGGVIGAVGGVAAAAEYIKR